MMLGSRRNRFRQRVSVRITSWLWPAWSASTEKLRPRNGVTPKTSKRFAVTASALSSLGSPPLVRFNVTPSSTSPIPASDSASVDHPRKAAGFTGTIGNFWASFGTNNSMATNWLGLGYSSGCRSTPLMTEKIAVLAANPKARVSTATTVKPGDLRSMRKPKRKS